MNMENGQVSRSIVMSNKSFVSAKVLEKLISTLRRLHQTKKTYAQLKNEVVKGLAEAQDVFTNISIPLVRLVDLKVDEMEKDGRKTVVFMTNNFETFREFGIEYETFQSVLSSTRRMLLASEEESFKSKAAYHTDQILYRLKCQVKQLMVLLKMIESLVRTQEQDLTQRFEDHQGFVSRMQNKFVSETMRLHQRVQSMKKSPSNAGQDSLNPSVSEQGYKALLSIALKLQQAVFDGFRKGLSELKDEMEGMINDLATHMSEPLISYLKRLSSEGIMSLVRQLQSLVEQMETDFVQHVPALLAANDRLLLQLRSSEIQLKERENELQKMAKSLKNALLKKGEETEEFRKRMRAQSKRIQELEKAVKEMEAKRFEDRQAVCAKDTQISSQREEALQKQEDFNRQLSMLREEIFQLKKLVENKNMRTSSEIFPAAKMRVMNSTNETRPNRGIQKFPNQKAATNIMRPNNTTFNSLLQPKTDGYTLYQRQPQVRYEKEEKFGDDFLSEILEKEQKGEIRCWNPDNINSRRGTNGTAAGGTTPKTSLVQLSFHNSSLNLDDGGEASIWGCSPTVPIHGEQQRPNTRSFARSLLQTSPIQKPLPSRNSPYCLRRNHGDPSKRNSPYGLPSSPWRR